MDDIAELDNCLIESLKYLKDRWYQPDTGIVTCALKDVNKIAYATSTKLKNSWVHAERNACNKFIEIFGKPSSAAIFIVSLSPCIKDLKYRTDSSCVDLIRSMGIKRVHFGVLDTLHGSSLTSYSKVGLIPSITENTEIKMMCSNLMGLFHEYDSRINNELVTIKHELGDDYFSIIDF